VVASAVCYFILLLCTSIFIGGAYHDAQGAYTLQFFMLIFLYFISLLHVMAFVVPSNTESSDTPIKSVAESNGESGNYSMSKVVSEEDTQISMEMSSSGVTSKEV
jgi:hypothetical protein